MEGASVTAATGALGPVVAKLSDLLGSEYKLRRRTRSDIKLIRSKLKSMHTLLWTIWEREHLDAMSKDLKKEALGLADDMEDAIDDFILSMEHSRSNRRFIQTKIEASPFQDFKKRVNDVSERCHSKWKKKKKTAQPTPRAPFVRKDASEIVGMDGPRDKLIQHLVGEEESTKLEPRLKMASIVGMAGMGKTTLADMVYEAIGNKFQSRAFVSVTPNPNMKEVLKSILEQVAAGSAAPLVGIEAASQEHLIERISNFLKEKRYLVIIDDIWHCEEWEIIRRSLPENGLGSRLVTTTQISAMAEKWHDDFDTLLYKMNPKRFNEWRYNIGEQDVTALMTSVNPAMVGEYFDSYGPVVYICGGVPLGNLCMFSAMTSMVREQQEQSGLSVKKRDMLFAIKEQVEKNGFQSIPGFEPLIESLKVGYNDLPHHMLKTCLLYCSMYYRPGQPFKRDILVTQWVAEGFVCKEKEARGYFDELVSRGLIQGPLTDLFEERDSREYGLHPTMAHFLKWRSREDNFITWISDVPSSYGPCGIRRLCIDFWPGSGAAEQDDLKSRIDWSHIRSLIVFKDGSYVPLKTMERLRMLHLGRSEHIEDHHLKDICGLFRLRHLFGVTGGDISVIPVEIVRLQYLETLEVMETSITELPGEMGKLWRLKTLNVTRNRELIELPLEIGDLQHLETLKIGWLWGLKKLPWDIIIRLKKLTTLDVSSSESMIELPREICKLQHLVTLDLSHSGITKLPSEIGNLEHLVTLDLFATRITELPREIGKLHNLEELYLDRTSVTKIPREIGGLKKLKMLDLGFGVGTLPWEALQLPNLVGVPECIRQAWKKSSDVLSSLVGAGEILSIQMEQRGLSGGLIVGTNHMHIPHWIRDHFKDVFLLDISICKLEEKDLKILREMPNLKDLQLRLQVVPREPIAISGEGFSRLKFLSVDSRVPRLAFQEGAMPMLYALTLEFKFYGGPPNRDPLGIKHLGSLRRVGFMWAKHWYRAKSCPCISDTIDVVKKEAQEHRNRIIFSVNVPMDKPSHDAYGGQYYGVLGSA
ncbi:unnamed protein product [Alopecurus aequalis]